MSGGREQSAAHAHRRARAVDGHANTLMGNQVHTAEMWRIDRIAYGMGRACLLMACGFQPRGSALPPIAVQDGQCWRWGAAIRKELAWKLGTQIDLGAAAIGSHSPWCDAAGSAGTVDVRHDQPHADANKPA